jgi:polar amino acid transport system substrate-binding protein
MLKKYLSSALVLIGILLYMSTLKAEVERILVDEGNPPFMYSEAGIVKGLYPALIKAIFKKMDVQVIIEAVPWKRALSEIDQGNAGIAGIYQTDERLQKYDYSVPIFVEELAFFVKVENKFQYTKIEDLNNKTVGVIRGWSYGESFYRAKKEEKFNVIEDKNDVVNFRKLSLNAVNVVVAIKESGLDVINKNTYKNKIIIISEPLSLNKTYLCFAKQEHKKVLLERFNKTFSALKESGELDNIIKEALSEASK